jgi:hypothetical protein
MCVKMVAPRNHAGVAPLYLLKRQLHDVLQLLDEMHDVRIRQLLESRVRELKADLAACER